LPLSLPKHTQGFYLLQRIRDYAHLFAITAHRKRRQKHGISSKLDSILGIGPARKKALLQKFGSVKNISNAQVEELVKIPGITKKLAREINEYLAG
jgi:excinuclease ABC subunit C